MAKTKATKQTSASPLEAGHPSGIVAMRLLVVMLCAFVVPSVVRADPADDAAVKAVERLGGKVAQNGEVVSLADTEVTDAGLKQLAAFKGLTYLHLGRTKVSDAGLKELAVLQSLTTLNLSFTKVTDAGLKELAGIKGLGLLGLENTKVTDTGVKEFRLGHPNCKVSR